MDEHADELLRRALIEPEASAAVALRVAGLPLCDTLTVVFHGRRDLGTIQTYVAHGGRGAGSAVGGRRAAARARATSTSAPPRTARRPRRCTPSRPARCATRWSAPTPCSTSGASRSRSWSTTASTSTAGSRSTSACPPTGCCRPRSSRPRSRSSSTAVCGARPLAEGRPPMGIVCAQQDVARVYPLPDDPERCLEDFLELAAEHARRVGEQLAPPGGLGAALPRALRRRRLPRRPAEPAAPQWRARAPPPSHRRRRASASSSSSASRSCSPAR